MESVMPMAAEQEWVQAMVDGLEKRLAAPETDNPMVRTALENSLIAHRRMLAARLIASPDVRGMHR